MSMRNIQVTQEDIDGGQQVTASGCAIALALRRQGHLMSSVGVSSFFVDGYQYENTAEMRNFVLDYDKSKNLVFPSEFLVDLSKSLISSRV